MEGGQGVFRRRGWRGARDGESGGPSRGVLQGELPVQGRGGRVLVQAGWVEELQLQLASKDGLTAENERLKALLGFKEQTKLTVLPARIIGRDPSIWFDSSIINRGSLDGVARQPIFVPRGGESRLVAFVWPRARRAGG